MYIIGVIFRCSCLPRPARFHGKFIADVGTESPEMSFRILFWVNDWIT